MTSNIGTAGRHVTASDGNHRHTQQQNGTGAPGSAPPGFPMNATASVNPAISATALPPISAYGMSYLTTPIPGDDPASRTLEALRVSQLNTQLELQQRTLEAAARDARWHETMTHQRLRRAPRRPRAIINDLAALGREQGVGFNEPIADAPPPTPARGLQAAAALVDRLQATPGDPKLLADLTQVLHRTVELQDNVSRSRDRLAGTDSVLSAANHPAREQRQDSVQRPEAAPGAEVGNLRQQISVVALQQRAAIPPRGPMTAGQPAYLPDPWTRATEHYGQNPGAPPPRFTSLTSSIAPACFGQAVIAHPFPQPFVVRGIEKYSGDTKPDHWLNDYLTAVEMANGDIGNALRHIPLCLTGHARSWLSGLPPNSIHNWADFEHVFLNNFEGTYHRPGSGADLHNIIQEDKESVRDYVARWLKKKNTLSNISDETAIEAFVSGAQDPLFRHKLGKKRGEGKLTSMAALMKVANDFATGEETARAGRRPMPGLKIAEPANGDASRNRSNKSKEDRKRKEEQDSELVAAANELEEAGAKKQRWNGKPRRPPRTYEEIMSGPCLYHSYGTHKAQHSTRECQLNEQLVREKGNNPGGGHDAVNDPAPPAPVVHQDQQPRNAGQRAFPKDVRRVNMITEEQRPRRHICRHHHTCARRHSRFLEWSEQTISFGQEDHPEIIGSPGRLPLVVDPLIGGCRFPKVLMDGGSGINILYVSTLHRMDVPLEALRPSSTEFHGIIPGNKVAPIGQITFEVAFGMPRNYRCELLSFRGRPLCRRIRCGPRKDGIRQIHGNTKLRLHAVKDARATWSDYNPWKPLTSYSSRISEPGGGRRTHQGASGGRKSPPADKTPQV